MKRFIEDLLFKLLIDQLTKAMYHLVESVGTFPWQSLCG